MPLVSGGFFALAVCIEQTVVYFAPSHVFRPWLFLELRIHFITSVEFYVASRRSCMFLLRLAVGGFCIAECLFRRHSVLRKDRLLAWFRRCRKIQRNFNFYQILN